MDDTPSRPTGNSEDYNEGKWLQAHYQLICIA